MHGDAGLFGLERRVIYLFFFLKRRHIFTTLFLKIKLAALPKNILKYNKRVQITLRLWETQIQGQFG